MRNVNIGTVIGAIAAAFIGIKLFQSLGLNVSEMLDDVPWLIILGVAAAAALLYFGGKEVSGKILGWLPYILIVGAVVFWLGPDNVKRIGENISIQTERLTNPDLTRGAGAGTPMAPVTAELFCGKENAVDVVFYPDKEEIFALKDARRISSTNGQEFLKETRTLYNPLRKGLVSIAGRTGSAGLYLRGGGCPE